MSTKTNQFRSLIAASGQAPSPKPAADVHEISLLRSPRRVGKRTAPDYVQVGVYLPKKVHAAAKVRLIQEEGRRDFSQLVGDLLTEYLNNRPTG